MTERHKRTDAEKLEAFLAAYPDVCRRIATRAVVALLARDGEIILPDEQYASAAEYLELVEEVVMRSELAKLAHRLQRERRKREEKQDGQG